MVGRSGLVFVEGEGLVRSVPVVVALISLLAVGSALPSPTDDQVVGTTAMVDNGAVPTEAVFRVSASSGLDSGNIVGAIHAVRRIDGGTVLYYSAAWESTPAGSTGNSGPYSYSESWLVRDGSISPSALVLVAPEAGKVYTPLDSGEDSIYADVYASKKGALKWNAPGELQVLYAVFPELPSDVSEVYVQLGSMNQMADRPVAVGTGALEPVVDSPVISVGSGWPKVPQGAELVNADPAAHTFPLYYLTGSEDGSRVNSEGDDHVVSTLAADVLFAKDSADLSSAAQSVLAEVGADIAARGQGTVVVTGNTDSDGTDEYNIDLSRRRAQAVVDALKPIAGSKVTFEVVAKGETDPVADNSTPEGQQANRRVTVAYEVDK